MSDVCSPLRTIESSSMFGTSKRRREYSSDDMMSVGDDNDTPPNDEEVDAPENLAWQGSKRVKYVPLANVPSVPLGQVNNATTMVHSGSSAAFIEYENRIRNMANDHAMEISSLREKYLLLESQYKEACGALTLTRDEVNVVKEENKVLKKGVLIQETRLQQGNAQFQQANQVIAQAGHQLLEARKENQQLRELLVARQTPQPTNAVYNPFSPPGGGGGVC